MGLCFTKLKSLILSVKQNLQIDLNFCHYIQPFIKILFLPTLKVNVNAWIFVIFLLNNCEHWKLKFSWKPFSHLSQSPEFSRSRLLFEHKLYWLQTAGQRSLWTVKQFTKNNSKVSYIYVIWTLYDSNDFFLFRFIILNEYINQNLTLFIINYLVICRTHFVSLFKYFVWLLC